MWNKSDKIWMAIACASFVFLAIVVALNYNTNSIDKSLHMGEFYEPAEYQSAVLAADSLYQSMVGSYGLGCPQTELKETEKGLIFINGLGKKYSKDVFMFATKETCPLGNVAGRQTLTKLQHQWDSTDNTMEVNGFHTISSFLGFTTLDANGNKVTCPVVNSASAVKINDLNPYLFANGDYSFCELVAPFAFRFENNNTDKDVNIETIVIVSADGNTRITFDNAANWFCAGPPTDTITLGEGLNEETGDVVNVEANWYEHAKVYTETDADGTVTEIQQTHYTIAGSSSNALVNGGSYGKVVGYADQDTTMKIEVRDNTNNWTTISLFDWLMAD